MLHARTLVSLAQMVEHSVEARSELDRYQQDTQVDVSSHTYPVFQDFWVTKNLGSGRLVLIGNTLLLQSRIMGSNPILSTCRTW